VAAEAEYRAALEVMTKLAAERPAVAQYRDDLANTHMNLGTLFLTLGNRTAEEAETRTAVVLRERLVRDFPAVPRYAVLLGGGYCNLGTMLRDRGDPAALDWFAKAVATLEPVYRADPRLATARQFLRNSYRHRAGALLRFGRPAEALADYDQALALDDGSQRVVLRVGRAVALAASGQPAQALAAADELAAAPGLDGGDLYELACVYAVAAFKLPPPDAEPAAGRAVDALRRAVAAGYRDAELIRDNPGFVAVRGRADFAQLLWDLADATPPGWRDLIAP
jgi:tetratricopeptide (TPR) repeat protein